jgi:hypothetical protein
LNRRWPDTIANGAMAHKIFGRNRLFHPGQIEILQSMRSTALAVLYD